jgi:uncharacterized membrane protein (UPF0136 family)
MNADMTLPVQQRQTDIACAHEDHRGRTIGYALIVVGTAIFLYNIGAFRTVEWRYVWPIALIGLGVLLLAHRTRS